jgi:hypothetical protein
MEDDNLLRRKEINKAVKRKTIETIFLGLLS